MHEQRRKEAREAQADNQTVLPLCEQAPERVTLAEATDGRETFKVIDREGKNIFDLVQAMLWNARRSLIDILKRHYSDERDVVNLFDHISRGQGGIKSTDDTICVRLEARDAPRFRHNKVRKIAKRESLSINQLLVNSISNEIIRYETMQFFAERAKDFSEQDFLNALQEIPSVEPEEHDKLPSHLSPAL